MSIRALWLSVDGTCGVCPPLEVAGFRCMNFIFIVEADNVAGDLTSKTAVALTTLPSPGFLSPGFQNPGLVIVFFASRVEGWRVGKN